MADTPKNPFKNIPRAEREAQQVTDVRNMFKDFPDESEVDMPREFTDEEKKGEDMSGVKVTMLDDEQVQTIRDKVFENPSGGSDGQGRTDRLLAEILEAIRDLPGEIREALGVES